MHRKLAVAAVFLFATGARVEAAKPADLVLRGGAVHTMNAARSWVSAVAITDRKISFAGDDRGVAVHIGPKTRVIELGGRMVLPGFHDSHVHPLSGGLRLTRCRLGGATTRSALRAAIRACAAEARDRPWLIGGGWQPSLESELTRQTLDELVPDRPAVLFSEDGFAAWINSRALEAAEIGRDAPSAGILRGDAATLVRSRMPAATPSEYRDALRRFAAEAHRFGITSLIDASTSEILLEQYRAADRAGELRLRVRAAQKIDPRRGPEQIAELIARRDRVRSKRLRADSAKIFLDGNPDQHTAALLAPYTDRPELRGDLLIEPQALDAIVARLDAMGFDIHMHASGDRAIRAGLDAIEHANAANGPRDRRHQLAHVELPDPADLPRFRRLGVAANLQLLWAYADPSSWKIVDAAFGADRHHRIHPVAGFVASGAVVVAGSDWPSPSLNPLEAIQIAVTRRALDGSGDVWIPEERIRLSEALAAYTIAGAWIAAGDAESGSIEVGKVGDLIVLERNLFDVEPGALHDVHVVLTIFDGDPVYRDEERFPGGDRGKLRP